MKIAIEAQRIFRTNKHGMDFVALETIRELQKTDHENEYYILVAPGEDRCLQASDNVRIVEIKCPTYPLWEQVALPSAIREIKPDIIHCTSNTAPLFCPAPLVLTLHDIIFLEKRAHNNKSMYQNMGWYYRRFVVPRVLAKCKQIITVSQFECNRIRETLHLPEEQIIAIHNGFSNRFHPLKETYTVTKKYIPAKEYLFFLGNTDPKKNTQCTLKAYSIYVKQSSNPLPLLIADLKEEVIHQILKQEGIEEIKPMLYSPGYITHSDLPAIYNGAKIFLYTSLRESFGIPLLEAMACGTPVVTSNTSAIPEVAGEGAILVDPTDADAIAAQILKLEQDAGYREQQIAYGLERTKQFSWQHTAEQLLKVYQSIKKQDHE
ncbi:glycosyltransferase family 1 protein [Butyricimonas sp. Marseille-P3923]|uniref:glycosyltransferase family 4 protein n=1 Tax=Butyricimonas sp. Marseille-P3923 TaxID=1987504 RepID=UPI000C06DBB6|nr:glycosyltransferase family 1 protein [Butyricimonas sp. Marseille-P3923]